jgi:hypothetical protein
VVAIMGGAVARPLRERHATRAACIRNLHMIDGAKEQWALENKRSAGDAVDETAVNRYIKGGGPRCPSGGTYTYGTDVQPVVARARDE